MGLVLSVLERCNIDVSAFFQLETPPPIIKHFDAQGRLVLVGAVWYDNILICTSIAAVALQFFQKFKSTCARINLELKRWVIYGPKAFHSRPTCSTNNKVSFTALGDEPPVEVVQPSFLNLIFTRMNKRGRDGSVRPQLFWNLAQKQILKVSGLLDILKDAESSELSCRQIAKCVGTILWHQHIAFVPLCRASAVIDISRRISSDGSSKGWSSPIHLCSDELQVLDKYLQIVCANEFMSAPSDHYLPRKEFFVATDSSSNFWGALVWSDARVLIPDLCVCAARWDMRMVSSHIFLKELTAAVIMIERLCHAYRDSEIVIVIDNTAAASVLRRLASSTKAGIELALRVDASVTPANNKLRIVVITSMANPADEPSRGRPIDSSKFAVMWELIDKDKLGIRVNLPGKPFKLRLSEGERIIRHEEAECTVDDSEECNDSDSQNDSMNDEEKFQVLTGLVDELGN